MIYDKCIKFFKIIIIVSGGFVFFMFVSFFIFLCEVMSFFLDFVYMFLDGI